jgi:8-oxo-dGTP diphosphatase
MALAKLPRAEIRKHQGVSFTGVSTVFFCYDNKGRVFLAKRSKNARDEHGRWTPGAGGHEPGETLEQTVRRELQEEFGAQALRIDFLGYFDVFRKLPDGTPTTWLAMTFAVLVDEDDIQIGEPEMFDESGWFLLDELPRPLHSQFDLFLRLHGDKLRAIITPA